MKLVSVIIPVYGAEKYIENTVQSVLNQTYDNLEILIIDDETPDKSIEICQQFTDSRIKIIHQSNRGLAGARNTGIRHACGEYLAFLDADDLWLPSKIEKHIAHLESRPNLGVSFSRSAFIDEKGKPWGMYQMSKLKDITPLDLLCRTPIGNGSAAVFKRQVFEEIKFLDNLYGSTEDFYFDEHFRESEDVECWLRIAIQTSWTIEGIAEPLTLYRVNSSGLSANLNKKQESWKKLIEKIRSYAPEQAMQWEKPALSYHLRYLSRRAVTLRAGKEAIQLWHQAIFIYWRILVEEPHRTFLTGAAAYLIWVLPIPLYKHLENLARKMTGVLQKWRIVQDQIMQA
ncbi:MAG: glycosyltransferase family 2 protein [Scytonema sp. PMC 1069.18]|nr:glycosyltransferase family 2 protein [Scytonema sp. PMC 1069.18]MEC4880483.1 glycosyltransferase family 2 protein [Scytonema sp. PMC 1070.18]